RPAEWHAQFQDYKGRTIIFDDVVRRDGDKYKLVHYEVIYEVNAGKEKAIVNLDLDLLRQLPLRQPRRLLFGAKLADMEPRNQGVWVIEFEKDSGVLLTDEGAVNALGLGPIDAELRELLKQQGEWSRTLP